MPEPIVAAENICRRDAKSNRLLLDHVSFAIGAGERIGLVGPSGAGKSVLMRALVLLDPVQHGEIHWHGSRVGGSEVPRYRSRVVYLPQHIQAGDATAESFLIAPYQWSIHREGVFNRGRIASWLESCEMPLKMLSQPMTQLSGGQRQTIALLRSLQFDPEVLLLDEATVSIDGETASKMETLLSEWLAKNVERSIVWTSHNRSQITRMTDRRITIEEGRIVDSPDS